MGGIEYEGSGLSEKEGILATKALLEKVFAELESPVGWRGSSRTVFGETQTASACPFSEM